MGPGFQAEINTEDYNSSERNNTNKDLCWSRI